MRDQAIRNTHPTVTIINAERDAWDKDGNVVTLDESAIATEVARLQAEHDSQEYARNRATAYASTGDQLDMQYWDSVNDTTTWKDHIASVKGQFPKV
jgi:hypothetical protein